MLMRKLRWLLPVLAVWGDAVPVPAGTGETHETVRIAVFSAEHIGRALPDGWKPLGFPLISGKTSYSVVGDSRFEAVIHARSAAGSGGLVYPMSLRSDSYPLLSWSWKISRTVPGSRAALRDGDDFPARVIVSFKELEKQKGSVYDRALCYVWGEGDPVDSFVPNPYHDHVVTVVAASGGDQAGDWMQLSRNVVDDYVTAFGAQPGWISAVTVMTDGDDTGVDIEAWYGPIVFSSPPAETR